VILPGAKRSVRESEKEKKGRDLPPQTHTGSSGYTDNDTPKGATRILNAMGVQQAYHERRRAETDGSFGSRSKGKGKASNQSQSLRNGGGKQALKIMPGETLGQFNRRLEDHMRPVVSQAIKDAAAKQAQQEKEIWQEKKKRREEAKAAKKAKEAKEAEEAEEEGGRKRRRRMPKEEDKSDGESETEEVPNKRRKEGATVEKAAAATKPTMAATAKAKPSATQSSTSDTSLGFAPMPRPLPLHDIAMAPPILPGLRKSKQPAATGHFAVTGRTPLTAGQKRLMEEERERVVARYREMKEAKRVEFEAAKAASTKSKSTGKTRKPE